MLALALCLWLQLQPLPADLGPSLRLWNDLSRKLRYWAGKQPHSPRGAAEWPLPRHCSEEPAVAGIPIVCS